MEKRTVNQNYRRESFNTMIDKETQKAFSAKCKEQGVKMNTVLEYFMQGYVNGDYEIVMIDKRALEKGVYKRELLAVYEEALSNIRNKCDNEEEYNAICNKLEILLHG